MLAKSALIIAACLCSSGVAHAQVQDLYVGGFFSNVAYKADGISTLSPSSLGFKIGSVLNPNISIEARLGFGVTDDTVTIQGIPVDVELDNFVGGYVKAIVPLADQVSVYGLIGYTRGEVAASAFGFTASDSDSDVSFGFGVDFKVASKVSLGLEWARLFSGPGYKVDALTAGVTFKF